MENKQIKHVVSFSGGMGSFAEAKFCVDAFGKENVLLLFADTLMEDHDLYRFLDEAVKFLDVELVTLCYGKNPFEIFKEVRFMGNSQVDPCSSKLKRTLLINYIKNSFTVENVNVHLGIDYSESHRIDEVKSRMAPYIYRSLLIENYKIIPKDYSERFGIKRPRLYDWGLGHNNCGGFCIKAGLGHYAALYTANKQRYATFERMEQEVYEYIGSEYPFLRKVVAGQKIYMSLKTFRELYLEKNNLTVSEKQEFGGCACAI